MSDTSEETNHRVIPSGLTQAVTTFLALFGVLLVILIGSVCSDSFLGTPILHGGWTLMQDFIGKNRRPDFPEVYFPLCFPAESSVWRACGDTTELITIQELAVGDNILTREGWSPVYAFMDACPHEQVKDYLAIHCTSGHCLRVSPRHMVYIETRCGLQALEARKLRVGDVVHVWSVNETGETCLVEESSQIQKLETCEARGYYAPLTLEGTLVVDGLLASCYATSQTNTEKYGISEERLLHSLHAPLRQLYQYGYDTASPMWYTEKGRHRYSDGLVHMDKGLAGLCHAVF